MSPIYLGGERTLELVQRYYTWKGLRPFVRRYVNECDSCQRVKTYTQGNNVLPALYEIPRNRWEIISSDFITGLPVSPRGNDSIWVIVDYLTKTVRLHALYLEGSTPIRPSIRK